MEIIWSALGNNTASFVVITAYTPFWCLVYVWLHRWQGRSCYYATDPKKRVSTAGSFSECNKLTWDCQLCASLSFCMTSLKNLNVAHTGACWSLRKKLPKAIKTTSDYLLQPEWSCMVIRRVFSSATTSEKQSTTCLTCFCPTKNQKLEDARKQRGACPGCS